MSTKSDKSNCDTKASDADTVINFGSIIIGILVFLTATAWIEFFRRLTDEVYLNEDVEWWNRYPRTWRALLIAIINVVILFIGIIIIYSWYQRRYATIQCMKR